VRRGAEAEAEAEASVLIFEEREQGIAASSRERTEGTALHAYIYGEKWRGQGQAGK